ncbi:MAG: hypothetical protein ABIW48_08790 [Burkholderiales bacterium]
MLELLNAVQAVGPVPLQEDEINAVAGAVSIYVDGVYWGEGKFDYWPWPGGRSSTGAPVVFK